MKEILKFDVKATYLYDCGDLQQIKRDAVSALEGAGMTVKSITITDCLGKDVTDNITPNDEEKTQGGVR